MPLHLTDKLPVIPLSKLRCTPNTVPPIVDIASEAETEVTMKCGDPEAGPADTAIERVPQPQSAGVLSIEIQHVLRWWHEKTRKIRGSNHLFVQSLTRGASIYERFLSLTC